MNIMEVDGYKAKIEYDSELDQFRGEIMLDVNNNVIVARLEIIPASTLHHKLVIDAALQWALLIVHHLFPGYIIVFFCPLLAQ